jgi:hypothetical protein
MVKKFISIILCGITASLLAETALAGTVTCPSFSNIVCTNGRWAVTGDDNWSSFHTCHTGNVGTSFQGASTITTYYLDKSQFQSGPFEGDYIPLGFLQCLYGTNDNRGRVVLAYTGVDKGNKSNFNTPSAWKYHTTNYTCITPTHTNCAITTT